MDIDNKNKIIGIFKKHPSTNRLYYVGKRFYLDFSEAKKHGKVTYINRSDFINDKNINK